MKLSALDFCNESIYPGEKLTLALTLPELFSCAPLYMPIKIIRGMKPGPVLLITAAMHGNELNGTEIINRLISNISPKKLSGTIIAIPVLNVYGLISRSRYLSGGVDLNTCFPGAPDGTHAARLANIFVTEVFQKVDYCIDLQTGFINYSNLPQIYIDFQHSESKRLAEAFNAPVILDMPARPGSLAALANASNIPFVLYEAGEAMRFDERSIKTGLSGITHVMQALNMIGEKSETKSTVQKCFFARQSIWVRAATSGITYTKHKLGQHIKKGDILCEINDPFGAREKTVIRAPEEGIIIGKNNLPLVQEGEGIFQLAVFSEMQKAINNFETWGHHASSLSIVK